MNRTATHVVTVAVLVAVAGGAFYTGRATRHDPVGIAPEAAASAPRTVLYWQDPMVPGQRFDKPGKSPFMDMQLVPVYADESAQSGVRISPSVQQNLGLRTAKVQRAELSTSFDTVGTVQFDERLNVAVQTRVAGYVEHLDVRAPMARVSQGQPLAVVYAPDWLGPLNDILALQRAGAAADLVAAARARTQALSIPPTLVQQTETTGIAQARFTLSAPRAGVVAELGVREGMAVQPGMTLFRIAGLDKVWAVAEIPEAQAVSLRRGQRVQVTLQADPTLRFEGALQEILPQVNTESRTLQARFEVDNRSVGSACSAPSNRSGRLTPGMLLRLQVAGPRTNRLVVPAEAVIRTGTRAVAIVRQSSGAFEPREIHLGVDLGEQLEVVAGLQAGDEVVVSSQFLVDSEARLRSVLGAMGASQ
jgi:Cu(I)/Ag(I) efflux system membrane fusion protein